MFLFLFSFILLQSNVNRNKTCDKTLKSVDNNDTEFPSLNNFEFKEAENRIRIHHCCQKNMCNDRLHITKTAKVVQAVLIKAFTNSIHPSEPKHKEFSNTTEFQKLNSHFITSIISKIIEQKLVSIFMRI